MSIKKINEEWATYQDYLNSEQWERVKGLFYERSNRATGVCFLCYSKDNLNLHHWRYPKNWSKDSYKNLIELCGDCHEVVHSIEFDKSLHNSYMLDSNSDRDLVKYLSWVIKATHVMSLARIEMLSNQF